jgi:hypothetical protein
MHISRRVLGEHHSRTQHTFCNNSESHRTALCLDPLPLPHSSLVFVSFLQLLASKDILGPFFQSQNLSFENPLQSFSRTCFLKSSFFPIFYSKASFRSLVETVLLRCKYYIPAPNTDPFIFSPTLLTSKKPPSAFRLKRKNLHLN